MLLGTSMRTSLAADRIDQLPLALLADVRRLGAEDLGQRRAALHRHHQPIDEAHHHRMGTRLPSRSIAVVNGTPPRRSARTTPSSRLSSPLDRDTARSIAPRGLSPAVTARQIRSARLGNSASMQRWRRSTSQVGVMLLLLAAVQKPNRPDSADESVKAEDFALAR
jgi:hypothetical protein